MKFENYQKVAIVKYLTYLKIKDYENANEIKKEIDVPASDLQAILFDDPKETKAICYVISYYLNNTELEGLHKNLYELFGNYKEAVAWLSDNDNLIKNIVYSIKS